MISKFATVCYAVGVVAGCVSVLAALYAASRSHGIAVVFYLTMSVVSYFIGRSSWYALKRFSNLD
jgi:hypothetical protein